MSHKKLAVALSLIVAGSPALAQTAMDTGTGAPVAGRDARYCLRVEAVTGTRLERILCRTRQEWIHLGVDLDREWAKEGVSVNE